MTMPFRVAGVLYCCSVVVGGEDNIFGVCYGPFPAKDRVAAAELIDDFMSEPAKPLWSSDAGRGDLKLIKRLGANTVRTYGNDPQYSHADFLEEAQKVGLGVVPGLSDFPYTQAKDACKLNGFNCYANIKESYLKLLTDGKFMKGGAYHPSLRHMVVINEPDLKTLNSAGIDPKMFSKLIISAVDGVVDAEKEAGITGDLIKLTATFSFGMCTLCPKDQAGLNYPALSQMVELRNAFANPSYYGYEPKNDLMAVWNTRWLNSFNTQNSASDLANLFFTPYQGYFPTTKVVVEEFHSWQPPKDQRIEVQTMVSMARTVPQLLGFQWFEFQVRYDKEANEQHFGIFGLGNYKIRDMDFFGHTYNVWCLTLEKNPYDNAFLADEYSAGIGASGLGTGFGAIDMCRPNPKIVSLDQKGFQDVKGLNSIDDMKTFVARVAEHLGYNVDTSSKDFATFAQNAGSFAQLQTALTGETHSWAQLDPNAACVADRNSNLVAVGQAIDEACRSTSFNCANVPLDCKGSIWDTADYVLSTYYTLKKAQTAVIDTMGTCNLNGAARYAPSSIYSTVDRHCVVNQDPERTPLTDEGFQTILLLKNTQKMREFITRYISKKFGGAKVGDKNELDGFASNPPSSMYDVYSLLKMALWVCGGNTNRMCRITYHTQLWWWNYAFGAVGITVLVAVMCSWIWVRMERPCMKGERSLTNFMTCRSCREFQDEDDDSDQNSEYSS